MSTSLHTETGPTVTQLVGGIMHDAQDLMRQQMALFRAEMQEDLRKTKEVAIFLACGFFLAQIGLSVLCFMFVYLLHSLQPAMPLWGCFGIVGGLLALLGAASLFAARNQANAINFVPQQTVETMKENVQWIKNQT